MKKHFQNIAKGLVVLWLAAMIAWAVLPVEAQQTVIKYLRQLQDVRLAAAPSDGQALVYNSSLAKWTNGTVSGSGVTAGQLASSNYTKFTDFSANNFNTNSPMLITNLYSLTISNSTLKGVTTIDSTAGVGVSVAAAPSTNVVDVSVSSATNILNAALTILHATNGATASERTHVRWLWTDGTTRALTIPSGWKTNVNSAVPASITNGAITKMYVTSIGDTSSSANQTNVFVSFEFYK